MHPVVIDVMGSVNLDEIIEVDALPGRHEKTSARDWHRLLGGAAANTATWLAVEYGFGVRLVGAVGDDEPADFCLAGLAAAGVDTAGVRRVAGARTARAWCLSAGGEKTIVTHREPELQVDYLAALDDSSARHVHLAGRLEPTEASRAAARLGARTLSVELKGYAPDALTARADLVFINSVELRQTFGLAIEELDGLARQRITRHGTVVVTDGLRRVAAAGPAGTAIEPVVPAEDPVDRTGAGDAFDAGFLAAWLRRSDPAAALRGGLAASRKAVARFGGSLP